MRPVTQSRTGETGTCFRASLASILNLKEKQVPDFGEANEDPGIDTFLAKYGLRYQEVPIGNTAPVGYHIITGISPRGGMHAVVGQDGQIVWDPHPLDGTAHGLTTQEKYGLLLPAGAKDGLFTSRLDRYSMEQLLDTLGIDIKEFLRRSVVQRERLLDTAIKELDRKTGRAKDMNTSEKERRTASTYRTQLQNRAAGSLQEAKLLRKEGNTARAEKFEAQAAKYAAEARKSDAELAVLAKNAAQGRDSDPRDGVTKCQACGVGLMGDDVLERGGKVICPECADAAVRRKAKDNGEFTWAEVKAEAARLRAQGKVVKILKHEFTNPRTGHVDTSYSCVVQPTLAKDATPGQLTKRVESLKKKEDTARGRVGIAEERRKMKGGQAGRIQSSAEQTARSVLSAIQRELYTAEQELRNSKPALDRSRLHRALDAVMDSEEKPVWKQIDETEVRIRKIINEYGRSNSKLPALQKKLKMLRASKVGN